MQIHIARIFDWKSKNHEKMHGPYEYFRMLFRRDADALGKALDEGWLVRLELFQDFVETPVLLALFIQVLSQCKNKDGSVALDKLPSSKGELYEIAVNNAITSGAHYTGDGDTKTPDPAFCRKLRTVEAHLCFKNMLNNERKFSSESVVRFLSPFKLSDSEGFLSIATKEKEASHAMAFAGASSGKELRCLPLIKILDDSKDDFSATGNLAGSYQSAHLSFQEYFAATRIANLFMNFDEDWRAAINRNKQDQMFFGRLSQTDFDGVPYEDGGFYEASAPFASTVRHVAFGGDGKGEGGDDSKRGKAVGILPGGRGDFAVGIGLTGPQWGTPKSEIRGWKAKTCIVKKPLDCTGSVDRVKLRSFLKGQKATGLVVYAFTKTADNKFKVGFVCFACLPSLFLLHSLPFLLPSPPPPIFLPPHFTPRQAQLEARSKSSPLQGRERRRCGWTHPFRLPKDSSESCG